jgi:hypothetical protein
MASRLRIDRRRHRHVGRRQIHRLLGTELIGGERDEIALGPTLLGAAVAEGGAMVGVHAERLNGQRLRRLERRVGADDPRQGQSRCADKAAPMHQYASPR